MVTQLKREYRFNEQTLTATTATTKKNPKGNNFLISKRSFLRQMETRFTFGLVIGLLCIASIESARSKCVKSTDLVCLRALNGYFSIFISVAWISFCVRRTKMTLPPMSTTNERILLIKWCASSLFPQKRSKQRHYFAIKFIFWLRKFEYKKQFQFRQNLTSSTLPCFFYCGSYKSETEE